MIFHQIRFADPSHIRCKKSITTIFLTGVSCINSYSSYVFLAYPFGWKQGIRRNMCFKYKSL